MNPQSLFCTLLCALGFWVIAFIHQYGADFKKVRARNTSFSGPITEQGKAKPVRSELLLSLI